MIEAANLIARISAQVPDLGSVQGALELAALLGSSPQVHAKPRAFVVPTGLRGGPVADVTGGFIQALDVTFSVFIAFSSAGDRAGKKRLDDVSLIQTAVINAICGWVPDGSTVHGEVRLARAYLAELRPGALVYALDFAVPDQVRILP